MLMIKEPIIIKLEFNKPEIWLEEKGFIIINKECLTNKRSLLVIASVIKRMIPPQFKAKILNKLYGDWGKVYDKEQEKYR